MIFKMPAKAISSLEQSQKVLPNKLTNEQAIENFEKIKSITSCNNNDLVVLASKKDFWAIHLIYKQPFYCDFKI